MRRVNDARVIGTVIATAIVIIAIATMFAFAVEAQGSAIIDEYIGGDLVLGEIAWAGTEASHYDEWFEVYNLGFVGRKTEGWYLEIERTSGVTSTIQLPVDTIPINHFGLYERTDDTAVIGADADGIFTGAIPNTNVAAITLRTPEGDVSHRITFQDGTWPYGTNHPKASMQYAFSTGTWYTSEHTWGKTDADGNPIVGTPGRLNSRDHLPIQIFMPMVAGN